MSDDVFQCLRDAVNMAKRFQIKTVADLRTRLIESGFTSECVQSALKLWAEYETSKGSAPVR